MKTLLAYATRGKATEEHVKEIAKFLRNKDIIVDVINLKRREPNLHNYTKIIVGSGVRAGKVYKEALNFLENDFNNKKVALFITSVEPEKDVKKKYMNMILDNNKSIKPIATAVFGGRIKILWKTLADGTKDDKDKVVEWSDKVLKKLK